jgi:hypothetical protein
MTHQVSILAFQPRGKIRSPDESPRKPTQAYASPDTNHFLSLIFLRLLHEDYREDPLAYKRQEAVSFYISVHLTLPAAASIKILFMKKSGAD